MPKSFRGFALALLLLAPVAARAQTPDATTLVRRVRDRAAENVAGVRSYTLAYVAGPTRTLAHLERTPKGEWIPVLGASGEMPMLAPLIRGTLEVLAGASASAGDSDELLPMQADVRADTAAGRRVYKVSIPTEQLGESGVLSMVAMVDAESYDFVRLVTSAPRPQFNGAESEPMVLWVDMLDYQAQRGVRIPGRYVVRGWNVTPSLTDEQRASILREMDAAVAGQTAITPEQQWMNELGRKMVETGLLEIAMGLEVVAVNQPRPPALKTPAP
ncbi:hypothetical protein [Longimicrobium terrae]|uniref:Uncharacterized protein n=1 Tax=Longimicrobium terrae TaxID=1639882 RepID=A0A841GYK8_9BACT|nr:hypothetical protein [Longimicrobium terrae]MBB4636643.1 hypothetical protein [Longimicrobium terrae]MBB6070833.1 hypothetical protein [Longimicrobium terrae]NNC28859.1 hypothetical protein [Longimicrobium terrae]